MIKRIQRNIFPTIIAISALSVSASAAFYSVSGLSKLFAGASFEVIIMAGSLEFGKLVTAAFLYRYWDKVSILQKFYLTIATVVLILITSAGIYGYLSNAYQGATVGFEKQSTKLLALEERLENLAEDKKFLKDDLEFQLSELPDNYRTAKRKLRESYNPQIQEVNQEVLDIKSEISDLELQLIDTGVDVGPAIYLAKVFKSDVDTVVSFFMLILIFVFDPLAVMLVIAYNQALIDRSKEKQTLPDTPGIPGNEAASQHDNWKDIYSQPTLIEDDERMDIIGQNGNDGLHYEEQPEPLEENDPNPQPTAKGGVRITNEK